MIISDIYEYAELLFRNQSALSLLFIKYVVVIIVIVIIVHVTGGFNITLCMTHYKGYVIVVKA